MEATLRNPRFLYAGFYCSRIQRRNSELLVHGGVFVWGKDLTTETAFHFT